jgi:hypothetical protein
MRANYLRGALGDEWTGNDECYDRSMIRRFATIWASSWGMLFWWTWVVGLLPFGQVITNWWGTGMQHAVLWFGRSVLQVHRPILFEATGSGDGVASWIEALVVPLLSVGLAIVWIVVTRGESRKALRVRLPHVARSTVRYGVGSNLLVYGVIKVFALQMWMSSSMLTQTVGSKSPMGMLWTFMGMSPGYQRLTGAAELFAGVLLFAKRTTLLGSLLGIVFMGQVFALNVFFDVPVKLFSFALLMSCVGLAFPDAGRLVSFFVLNRATQPSQFSPTRNDPDVARTKRSRRVTRTGQLAALALFAIALYRPVDQSLKIRKAFGSNSASAEEKRKFRLYQHGIRWIQERPDNQ